MRKIRGYTIVETLLSLTIIVVSVGIGFTVYENLMQSFSSYKRMHARNEIDAFIFKKGYLKQNEDKINENIEFEVVRDDNWQGCFQVKISYFDNEDVVYSQSIWVKYFE